MIDHAEVVAAMNKKYGKLYVTDTIAKDTYSGMASDNKIATVWNILEPGVARRRHEHAQRVAPVHPARGRGDHAPGLEHEPADQLSAPGAELEPQAGSPQARHLRDARQVEVGQGAGQERHDGSTSDPATTLRTIASLAAGGCTLSRPIFIAVDTRP